MAKTQATDSSKTNNRAKSRKWERKHKQQGRSNVPPRTPTHSWTWASPQRLRLSKKNHSCWWTHCRTSNNKSCNPFLNGNSHITASWNTPDTICYQHNLAIRMEISWRNPITSIFQLSLLIIYQRTHGHLFRIILNLIGPTITMFTCNPPSLTFWKALISGMPWLSSTWLSTQQLKIFHGIMLTICMCQLMQYKLAMHHGEATSFLIMDQSHLCCCSGWWKHMNSTHVMHYLCLNSNWIPLTSTARSTMYALYEEFNGQGDHIYSNLMSGNWVNSQAVSFFRFHQSSKYSQSYINF